MVGYGGQKTHPAVGMPRHRYKYVDGGLFFELLDGVGRKGARRLFEWKYWGHSNHGWRVGHEARA